MNDDLPDYELRKTPSELPPAPAGRRAGVWMTVALLAAAAGAAGYWAFVWRPRPAVTPAATSAPKAEATEPLPSLGGNGEPIALPPLDASDGLVRTLVRALSESPVLTAWLTTDGLIRNFTVVVVNIADGVTPAKHLPALRPASAFSVIERAGGLYVDPKSYARYDIVADAFASLDPLIAAKLYGTLKPRIEEAHRDLGSPNPSVDRTLRDAIAALLATPVLDEPVRLVPKGIGYAYADERVERLTGAQKQLLRMGPRNVRIVKETLRRIGAALGIPQGQLPPP